MPDDVKGRRRRTSPANTTTPARDRRAYDSALRREQAASTRARILDAAEASFRSAGYAATTIKRIAHEAGVAVDTVYATFGTKARVLTALIDRGLVPSGDTASVLDSPPARAVRDETDPLRQVHRFGASIAQLSERTRPMAEILRTASAVEADLAPVYDEMEGHRLANMRQVARWFAARGPLRTSARRAGDVVYVLTSPDVARLLCDRLGWTSEQYGAWLADTLARTLLDDAVAGAPKRPRT